MNMQNNKQNPIEEQHSIIGAIKIKDGLFIGDEYAAQDLEFVITNKVTHIINCAGQSIGNIWEQIGVMYLTFPWTQSDQQILFDEQDEILNEIVKFIDEAAEAGESTLVHSVKGQSRACCVLASYFMKKYNWALLKTLEFLNSRRPDLEIRSSFFQQLTNLSKKLQITGAGAMIQDWNEISYFPNGIVNVEELIIRNTFLNSRNAPVADIFSDEQIQLQMMRKEKKDKLTWNDIHHNRDLHVAVFPNPDTFNPIQHYRQSSLSKKPIKSCLKGSNKHSRVGSEGAMLQQNQQQQKNGMTRSMSGKQIGVFGPQLKYNKSVKTLVEDASQLGNQPSFLLNSSQQKTEISSCNNISNSNFYSNNNLSINNINQIQNAQNQQINGTSNSLLQNKNNSNYSQQLSSQSIQQYSSNTNQQSSFQQHQPLLSQQIRHLQQQIPINNQNQQINSNSLNNKSGALSGSTGILAQQYQQQQQQLNQLNSQQYSNISGSQLQTLNIGNNFSKANNSNTSGVNDNNTSVQFNLNNNENKQNLNIPNPITSSAQQIKTQGEILLRALNSANTSSKNSTTFQNSLTLNSGNNSGSKSISSSAITSPYNQKSITNALSSTLNDKKIAQTSNSAGNGSSSGNKSNKMMPPQSAQMQEKKQNLISKILEQQQPHSSSSSNTNSTTNLIRSNSLRAFDNEKDSVGNKNNLSAKNSIQTYLNPQGNNNTKQSNTTLNNNNSSNMSLLQKNNTSFGSQLGTDPQTNKSSSQNLQIQSGYRSNSLPKKLDEERSPQSNKLNYQLQANNRPSSVSNKEKQESLLQQQKNQFSYLNNEMKNSQIQQGNNLLEKPLLQNNYVRTQSAHNSDTQSNSNSNLKNTDNLYLSSQSQAKQAIGNLLQTNKSPVSNNNNNTKGYIKNERPPLKPREQNSLTSTTNNTNSTINTSLSKSFQQSNLTKYSINSNVQSQQTSTSDSNRFSSNTYNQFSTSINQSNLSSQDLQQAPSSSSLTQTISNKITSGSSGLNSETLNGNDKYSNIIPSSNKSPINSSQTMKTSLISKPPQSKPQQSFDKSLKENYNIQPYTVYQPMTNNFMETQKLKESLTIGTSNVLSKQSIGKQTPQYRSFSPDIQSNFKIDFFFSLITKQQNFQKGLQNKLDKQKQLGTSKNRIRSNSPGQALTLNQNYTNTGSSLSYNQIQPSQNVFVDQKIDYLKQSSNINAISSESDNIFTVSSGLLNSNIQSNKPRWKF
ncbi:dual specificity phosphatase domain protein (macronuclear) [Tetrahymena thermophila SB210]|uniref:Dual specificity phosphatase domain protein n=1 Tax=Tetrahymena thermophila (strain SB210) TaxID=312017 RepID=I7M3W2_TETTS|nr:dual specificity phosphatase domain protein [Tetrahymena thermophila SB210]EAS04407.2 dual specificity phosphatase domain protein [Tetrahymena thermophila SB210]|eukprot:XP_001024652.2 dual specificity phosphatase domain protein [Tetrahymena thermophila SB210]